MSRRTPLESTSCIPFVFSRCLGEMERRGILRLWLLFSLCHCFLDEILTLETVNATVLVNGSAIIAETDDNFVCATLDWWPPEKCNYNQCPWGQASVLNLDLNHTYLAKAIQAFDPLRIRVGGSLQDQVIYDVGNTSDRCVPFRNKTDELFGFTKGCLTMKRWDELNDLFQKTRAIITFGLNALMGRQLVRNGLWGGPWNSMNARDFIAYTVSKGYRVDSWEFGNELSGNGIGASVSADDYGKDLIGLKAIISVLYRNQSLPVLVAPGGFFDKEWYGQLLQVSGPGVVNAVSHHIYNLGGGDDLHLANKITDPQYLSQVAGTYSELQHTLQTHGPWASAWVSEAGGAYNSGGYLISDTFLNSFWYTDQLGISAQHNTKVYCRQALIGGNYGLLDEKTFIPNPDYYSALLWHRLMGKRVLSTKINGSSYLRAYAHCSKTKAGISMLLINLSNTTEFRVAIQNDTNSGPHNGVGISKDSSFLHGLKKALSWVAETLDANEMREEYHLTPKDGNYKSQTMLLNGKPLMLTEDGGIPDLDPVLVAVNSSLCIAPLSITFVVLPNFEVKTCV